MCSPFPLPYMPSLASARVAPSQRVWPSRSRFTLIELLVVIAIIAILAGILLPVLTQARKRSYFTKCMSNMSQFAQATSMYRGDCDDEMPGWLSNLGDYNVTPELLICPQDMSMGYDGGRPGIGSGGDSPGDGVTVKDMYGIKDYNITWTGSGVFDDYRETDDTEFNSNTLYMPRGTHIKRCSYMYEFSGADCDWWQGPGGDDSSWSGSWNKAKNEQLRGETQKIYNDAGDVVKDLKIPYEPALFPSVRCFYHWGALWGKTEMVLNSAYDGSVFKSRAKWEEGTYD